MKMIVKDGKNAHGEAADLYFADTPREDTGRLKIVKGKVLVTSLLDGASSFRCPIRDEVID
jgi:hypothetical protein